MNYENAVRPPLLSLSRAPRTASARRLLNEALAKKQRQAPSATEAKVYPGRCHYPGQDGWEEVADFILGWTVEHSNQPRGALA